MKIIIKLKGRKPLDCPPLWVITLLAAGGVCVIFVLTQGGRP